MANVLYGISDADAQEAHDAESDHPTIHCNRFISWNELSRSEKNRYKRQLHLKRQGKPLDVVKNGPAIVKEKSARRYFTRYVARPMPVFALKWTGINIKALNEGLEAYKKDNKLKDSDIIGKLAIRKENGINELFIVTMEGSLSDPIKPGNYIIIGMKNELYPCDKEIFEAKYARSDL